MPTATAPTGRRRPALGALGVLAALSALCAYLLGAAPPAAAHAVLTGSDPASGAVVASAPEEVVLTFSERVRLGEDSLRVLGPDGDRVDTGEVRDHTSSGTARYGAPLRGDLPDGTYTVAWQAVSADSHPISGAFTFSIGAPSETSVALPEQQAGGGTVGLLYDLARYAAYAGFVLLVGGAAFVLVCWPGGAGVRGVQRVVTGGWVGLTAATFALLLLRTPYTGSGELTDAFDLDGLGDVVGTKTGAALVSRLLLLATAALFTAVLFGTYARLTGEGAGGPGLTGATDREGAVPEGADGLNPARRRDLVAGLGIGGAVVATGLAVTWAASQHASTGPQTAVAIPVDVVHLLAVAAWLGGLTALVAALFSGTGAVPPSVVRRFSRIALGSVAVLAATGAYQSWRQVGSWSALTGTEYGRLLLLKVALIVGLVALGAASRRWTAHLADPAATAGLAAPRQAATAAAASETVAAVRGSGPVDRAGPTSPTSPSGPAGPAGPTATGQPGHPATTAPPGQPVPHDQEGQTGQPEQHDQDGQDRQDGQHGRTERTPAQRRGPHTAEGAADITGANAQGVGGDPDRDHATAGRPAGADPARAAQLARQRAAVAEARRRRARDADPRRVGLRRSVLAEACVAAAVLAATTLLTGTEPARTAASAPPGAPAGPAADAPAGPREATVPFDTGGPQGRGTAEVTLDPGRTGRNALDVRLTDPAGNPLDVPEVRVSFTLPAKDIGPLRVTPRETGPGRWRESALRLPVPGTWEMALTVRTSDIDQITETRTVRIG